MLKSMTGFGRSEIITTDYKVTVEIKSVNHRYLDLSIKMPKRLNFFETSIRNLLKDYIKRGKVDVFITYESYTDKQMVLKYNRTLAAEYLKYLNQMEQQFEIPNDVSVTKLSRYPEVLVMEQAAEDQDEVWKQLSEVITQAAVKFVESRAAEGEQLKKDLFGKLATMLLMVAEIEKRSPQIIEEYQKKLREKVSELLENTMIDEARIATEVVLFADKSCVDEETVRLRSHIENTKAALSDGESIGRKLDFIAQEMNREANTILSKANDLSLSDYAITLKTEIEKIREQIQNIE